MPLIRKREEEREQKFRDQKKADPLSIKHKKISPSPPILSATPPNVNRLPATSISSKNQLKFLITSYIYFLYHSYNIWSLFPNERNKCSRL